MDPDRHRVQRDRLHRRDRRAGHPRPGFLAGELSKRENATIARQLDAAISGSLRPTTLIRRVQPRSKWDALDFALYEAHHIRKGEISTSSGHPLWLTRSLDANVGWVVEESIDQADAALDAWDKAHSGETRKDGAGRHVVPVANEGSEHLLEGGLAREHHFLLNHELSEGADRDDESSGLDIDRKMPPGGYDPRMYG